MEKRQPSKSVQGKLSFFAKLDLEIRLLMLGSYAVFTVLKLVQNDEKRLLNLSLLILTVVYAIFYVVMVLLTKGKSKSAKRAGAFFYKYGKRFLILANVVMTVMSIASQSGGELFATIAWSVFTITILILQIALDVIVSVFKARLKNTAEEIKKDVVAKKDRFFQFLKIKQNNDDLERRQDALSNDEMQKKH